MSRSGVRWAVTTFEQTYNPVAGTVVDPGVPVPFAFHDLPLSAFPFTVEIWARGTDRRGAPDFSVVCTGAGALGIPALGPGAWVRVTYPDDDVNVVAPEGERAQDF